MSIPAGGRGGAGERPPPAPAGDPRSVAPRGRLAPRLNRGIPASRVAASACCNCPNVDTRLGQQLKATARTSYEAVRAPVPGRVRTCLRRNGCPVHGEAGPEKVNPAGAAHSVRSRTSRRHFPARDGPAAGRGSGRWQAVVSPGGSPLGKLVHPHRALAPHLNISASPLQKPSPLP